jgi:hypothetical protein
MRLTASAGLVWSALASVRPRLPARRHVSIVHTPSARRNRALSVDDRSPPTGGRRTDTTFSTWMVDSCRPAVDGRIGLVWLNLVGSMTGGVVAAIGGWLVAGTLA